MTASGKLYIVATPIGNLADISSRALQTLSSVDMILAEDTRHSQKLLNHYLINNKITSFHDHNEKQKVNIIIEQLLSGKNIALISDAGTPLISDPGYSLTRHAHQNNITIIPIPGACALIAALSAAGLATDKFSFYGFLPNKQAARQTVLNALLDNSETLIFYEAPQRIMSTLDDIRDLYGMRIMAIASEISKRFETIKQGTADHLIAWLSEDPKRLKGEFVLIIEGNKQVADDLKEAERILQLLASEVSASKAVELTAKITGVAKNKIYKLSVKS